MIRGLCLLSKSVSSTFLPLHAGHNRFLRRFSIYKYKNKTELYIHYIYIYTYTYTYIYTHTHTHTHTYTHIHTHTHTHRLIHIHTVYIYTAVSNGKKKSRRFFLNPFTVCWLRNKRKLFVHRRIKRTKQTKQACPFMSRSMPGIRVRSMPDIRVISMSVSMSVPISGPISVYISMSMSKSRAF
jgi:hypothetical protein